MQEDEVVVALTLAPLLHFCNTALLQRSNKVWVRNGSFFSRRIVAGAAGGRAAIARLMLMICVICRHC